MNLAALLVPLVVAFCVAAMATPIVSRVAKSLAIVDRPNERKVSRRDGIPLLGGIAVALGFFVGIASAILIGAEDGGSFRGHAEGFLVGGAVMLIVGVYDDRFTLRARTKLLGQIGAAAIAIYYGFQIDYVREPIFGTKWEFHPVIMFAVTTFWIVGITNAMNLLDGLDGLATGVGAIVAATLTYICWQAGETFGMTIGLAFVGSLLGFLPFNFSPARIFLGDTGALFMGYTLSILALEGYAKATLLTFVVPILALAVPILDMGLSVLRRLARRRHIFDPDRQHMHHRLLDSVGSHRDAVLSIYFLTGCFCVIAVSFTRLEGFAAIVFLVLVVILTGRLLKNLGFLDHDQAGGG